ncbi:MAG: hypothetical protein ACK4FZ_09520 [Vogesella sp.]|jgi:hypothetical protein|uniref:hypothetical protein n=1 Tax=Vogesella sp. TaxID=1904252 RepID=UPI00391D4E27
MPAGHAGGVGSLLAALAAAFTPAAVTSTAVPTTVAPTDTAVDATDTAALATDTAAHPVICVAASSNASCFMRILILLP